MSRGSRRKPRLVRGAIPPDVEPTWSEKKQFGHGDSLGDGDQTGPGTWEELALIRSRRIDAAMACRVALGITFEEALKRVDAVRERAKQT